jgi:cytidylate kinase
MTQGASPPVSVPVIAIDGPSGSGKGTISRAVANALKWHLLDSGALYRLVALAARRAGAGLDDASALQSMALRLDIRFGSGPEGEERVWLDGADVTRDIRTEAAGGDASRVAAIPAVRAALLARQRAFAVPPGLVADGRDMGTAVFPEAEVKIFLTASPEERALRRHNQLKEKGVAATLAALSLEIAERDRRDISRSASPLIASAEAVLLDTTGMPVEAVVSRVLEIARGRLSGGS